MAMPSWFPIVFATAFGLATGSFLNVCIFRIPYGRPKGPPQWDEEGEEEEGPEPEAGETISIVKPSRSFCPECKATLRWYHNIPLLSWILLRGKCSFCSAPISIRYPIVELLGGGFAVLCYLKFGISPTALTLYVFCCAMVVISFIDIDYYIIPDVISYPGIVIGFGLAVANYFVRFRFLHPPLAWNVLDSFLGILIGGGILLLISELYLRMRKRIGLGLGDVKLLAMTGAFLGIEGAIRAMFVGSLLGAAIGILLIVVTGKKMTHQLPFGPFLALGALAHVFAFPVGSGGILGF